LIAEDDDMEDAVWVLVPVTAIIMWGVRGIAVARQANRGADDARLKEEVRELRAEVERLREGHPEEALEGRLLELEERVDFAERLLARNEPRTPPSGH
jgi:hypothetical protein